MTMFPSPDDFAAIRAGYSPNASRSFSLNADAYTSARWFEADELQNLIMSPPTKQRIAELGLV